MPAAQSRARMIAIEPLWAIEGGRINIRGSDFPVDLEEILEVRLGGVPARIVHASSTSLGVLVPADLEGGSTPVQVASIPGATAFVEVGAPIATGLHQIDNPVYDDEGNLYLTYSGSRGQEVPVSIFRVARGGARESFVSGIVNPTSMAIGPEGNLYVSSRFEGNVYRVGPNRQVDVFASDLGVACGLAFAPDGALYVGDRSGTIFRVAPSGKAATIATLPASVAAFHLAMGPDECLYVTGPTFGSYDHVYRVTPGGEVEVVHSGFGRPQGLCFDAQGSLYVVEALAGMSGVCRLMPGGKLEVVLAGPGIVGLVLDPRGGLVVSSNETAYRLDVNARPLRMSYR